MVPPERLGGEHEHKAPAFPERYGVTRRFLLLRACERMGGGGVGPPDEWIASLSAAGEAELLAYERLRQHQEAEEFRALMAAGGARF